MQEAKAERAEIASRLQWNIRVAQEKLLKTVAVWYMCRGVPQEEALAAAFENYQSLKDQLDELYSQPLRA